MSDHALPLRLLPEQVDTPASDALVDSYRRLADVFHAVLAEQSLDALFDRIADALADLIPHDCAARSTRRTSRGGCSTRSGRATSGRTRSSRTSCPFGEGLTGWGVEHREAARVNQAHLDPASPRVRDAATSPRR